MLGKNYTVYCCIEKIFQFRGSFKPHIIHLIGIAMMTARVHDFNFGKKMQKDLKN